MRRRVCGTAQEKGATQPGSTHFAIASEKEGGAVGGIGYEAGSDVDRFTAEVGYWLGEPFWGRGWMTRVVSAFADCLLGPVAPQEFVRLEARIYDFNPASGRVLEKAGFQFEGRHRKAIFKRGRFADTLCYARVGTTDRAHEAWERRSLSPPGCRPSGPEAAARPTSRDS